MSAPLAPCLTVQIGSIWLSFLFGQAWSLCPLFFSRSLFLHAARILSSSSVLLFCSHSVCSSLPWGSFYLILRSLVAAVTPGHPNQSLCPVCVGVQRRERLMMMRTLQCRFFSFRHIKIFPLTLPPRVAGTVSLHWVTAWRGVLVALAYLGAVRPKRSRLKKERAVPVMF